MTITDAFLASRYEHSLNIATSVDHIDFTGFLDKLCDSMINNVFLEGETTTTRQQATSSNSYSERPVGF